jgi:hypothetical protein
LTPCSAAKTSSQDVIGLLIQDLLGDIALTAHGAEGYNRPFDCHHLKQCPDPDDLV